MLACKLPVLSKERKADVSIGYVVEYYWQRELIFLYAWSRLIHSREEFQQNSGSTAWIPKRCSSHFQISDKFLARLY